MGTPLLKTSPLRFSSTKRFHCHETLLSPYWLVHGRVCQENGAVHLAWTVREAAKSANHAMTRSIRSEAETHCPDIVSARMYTHECKAASNAG